MPLLLVYRQILFEEFSNKTSANGTPPSRITKRKPSFIATDMIHSHSH